MAGYGIATRPRGSAKLRKVVFGTAVAVVPAAIGGAIGMLARSRKAGLVAGGVTALALGLGRWQFERSFNDEPDYTVERRVGGLEIRRYAARVEAETMIDAAGLELSLERGFDRLAEYIFGKNDRRETLGMTTPILSEDFDGDRRVSFIMPIERPATSLPRPADADIAIVEVPARRVAVLAFIGGRRDELVARKIDELRRLVAAADLTVKGEPVYAGFDPPWTLPFLRRNEVWIELA